MLPGQPRAPDGGVAGADLRAAHDAGAEVFVNLFVGSDATIDARPALGAHVTQTTSYPWDGDVTIHVDPDRAADFTLNVRMPGWTRNQPVPGDLYRFAPGASADAPVLKLNGSPITPPLDKGFAHIARRWNKGDVVTLSMPMPIRRVLANDRVSDDQGKAAIQRGPLVYCLEAVDNNGKTSDVTLPLDAPLAHTFNKDLLGGIEVITGGSITAIPYYAWANRGRGEMSVWIPIK